MLDIIALTIAFFMGINIGGNNAAASMGAAYGAKVRTKIQAVILIGVFSFIGAVTSGGEVIKTLGKGLVYNTIFIQGAIVIVAVAAISIFIANIIRVPISTSQAAVGAVVGFGLVYGVGNVNTPRLGTILVWWVVTPLLAWLVTFLIGRYLYTRILLWLTDHESEASIRKLINGLLTLSGCYVAFSAGANNAANAVGPFVAAGTMSLLQGAVLGGLSLALGALVLGGRVLDTVGKDITELCAIRAVIVEFTAAFIVHIASIMGIPVSLAEIVTAGVIGVGCGNVGMHVAKSDTVKKIGIMWVISPVFAGLLTFIVQSLM